MMVIKQKTLCHWLIPVIVLLGWSTGACAQQRYEKLWERAADVQGLESVSLSSGGQWAMARLPYEDNGDTLLVFNTSSRIPLLGKRVTSGECLFIGTNALLVPFRGKAELWNLKSNTSIHYEDVMKTAALDGQKFIIHFGAARNNALVLFDAKGKALYQVDKASRFQLLPGGRIGVITDNPGNGNGVVVFNAKGQTQSYIPELPVDYLDSDASGTGLLLFMRNESTGLQEITYFELATQQAYALKDVLPLKFQHGLSEPLPQAGSYFLRLTEPLEKQDALLDIWYGIDPDLPGKYFRQGRETAYIWEPAKKKIVPVGSAFPKNVSLGNGRYFLGFDPSALQDYTQILPDILMSLYDHATGQTAVLDTLARQPYVSANGNYILSGKNGLWKLYDLENNNKHSFVAKQLDRGFFTDDGKGIVFEGHDAVWYFDIRRKELKKLVHAPGCNTTLVNGVSTPLPGFPFLQIANVDFGKHLLISTFDPSRSVTAYLRWYNNTTEVVLPHTSNHITSVFRDRQTESFCYISENYNLPPRLVYKESTKGEKVLFATNIEDTDVAGIRQEIISYRNVDSGPLQGILFYPVNYSEGKQYPMVVHIYEQQRKFKNAYLSLSRLNPLGHNTRALLEMGYFVYYPDIEYGAKGPGVSALECVTNALDALKGIKAIDQQRIGLIGQSFGGYETNFIATHCDRFAAYISGTAPCDIVNTYHSFNTNIQSPDFWRFETGQFRMHQPFSVNKELYYSNNPLYDAEKVTAPMLLWTGDKDENVRWEDTRTFYDALRRNHKEVIALFYRNEGHSISSNEAMTDLSIRVIDWFEYFLKDNKDIPWISTEIKTKKGAK